jgi:hypothetical protein
MHTENPPRSTASITEHIQEKYGALFESLYKDPDGLEKSDLDFMAYILAYTACIIRPGEMTGSVLEWLKFIEQDYSSTLITLNLRNALPPEKLHLPATSLRDLLASGDHFRVMNHTPTDYLICWRASISAAGTHATDTDYSILSKLLKHYFLTYKNGASWERHAAASNIEELLNLQVLSSQDRKSLICLKTVCNDNPGFFHFIKKQYLKPSSTLSQLQFFTMSGQLEIHCAGDGHSSRSDIRDTPYTTSDLKKIERTIDACSNLAWQEDLIRFIYKKAKHVHSLLIQLKINKRQFETLINTLNTPTETYPAGALGEIYVKLFDLNSQVAPTNHAPNVVLEHLQDLDLAPLLNLARTMQSDRVTTMLDAFFNAVNPTSIPFEIIIYLSSSRDASSQPPNEKYNHLKRLACIGRIDTEDPETFPARLLLNKELRMLFLSASIPNPHRYTTMWNALLTTPRTTLHEWVRDEEFATVVIQRMVYVHTFSNQRSHWFKKSDDGLPSVISTILQDIQKLGLIQLGALTAQWVVDTITRELLQLPSSFAHLKLDNDSRDHQLTARLTISRQKLIKEIISFALFFQSMVSKPQALTQLSQLFKRLMQQPSATPEEIQVHTSLSLLSTFQALFNSRRPTDFDINDDGIRSTAWNAFAPFIKLVTTSTTSSPTNTKVTWLKRLKDVVTGLTTYQQTHTTTDTIHSFMHLTALIQHFRNPKTPRSKRALLDFCIDIPPIVAPRHTDCFFEIFYGHLKMNKTRLSPIL